jgi:hypothetical protein
MKTLNRKFTMMSVVFASLLTFTASANAEQPSLDASLTNLVVSQGKQVITHLQAELAQTIQNELNSFSIDIAKMVSTEEQETTVAKTESTNTNQNIATEE